MGDRIFFLKLVCSFFYSKLYTTMPAKDNGCIECYEVVTRAVFIDTYVLNAQLAL